MTTETLNIADTLQPPIDCAEATNYVAEMQDIAIATEKLWTNLTPEQCDSQVEFDNLYEGMTESVNYLHGLHYARVREVKKLWRFVHDLIALAPEDEQLTYWTKLRKDLNHPPAVLDAVESLVRYHFDPDAWG